MILVTLNPNTADNLAATIEHAARIGHEFVNEVRGKCRFVLPLERSAILTTWAARTLWSPN